MYKLRIILAMFIFGTLGLFVKNINLASSEIAFWRAAIAIVVLCVCLIFSKRKNKRKMDRVNEGKSVDSYQHLMIYLETEQPGW